MSFLLLYSIEIGINAPNPWFPDFSPDAHPTLAALLNAAREFRKAADAPKERKKREEYYSTISEKMQKSQTAVRFPLSPHASFYRSSN